MHGLKLTIITKFVVLFRKLTSMTMNMTLTIFNLILSQKGSLTRFENESEELILKVETIIFKTYVAFTTYSCGKNNNYKKKLR